jgi:hypothetical protein
VVLSGVHFMIDDSPSRRAAETKRPFCLGEHPEYPWADLACNLIASEEIPDNPVRVNVDVAKARVDWVAKEREAMKRNPASTAPDGVRTYRRTMASTSNGPMAISPGAMHPVRQASRGSTARSRRGYLKA